MESEIGPNEPVSTAVVRAVSAVDGREPEALPPLADVLDPGAVDALFGPRTDGSTRRGGRLSFVYAGCRVTIDNGEYLTIQPLDLRPGRHLGNDPTAGSSGPRRR